MARPEQAVANCAPNRARGTRPLGHVPGFSVEGHMSEVIEKTKKPKRRRSGTAKWHMSREAVDLPLDAVYKMDEKACWEFFVETRFGSKDTVRCPYCGSIGRHK